MMLAKIRAQLLELDTSVRTIGRFEILSRLGAGGMGTVWAARDPELDRKVAIKFLHDAVDPHERLRREAQALARLRHPNIVGVHEIGVDAPTGRKFVVMELVEGGDLAAWLATPRPWPSIVEVFAAASRGLAAAHA
ncbi:MAG: protein kinase, partial [Myxococcales bacterium]|nr:protein kinase [Myxococcales bacterium]